MLKKGEGLELLADSLEILEEMGLMAPVGSVAATSPQRSSSPTVKSASGGASVKPQLVALAQSILGDKAGVFVLAAKEIMEKSN